MSEHRRPTNPTVDSLADGGMAPRVHRDPPQLLGQSSDTTGDSRINPRLAPEEPNFRRLCEEHNICIRPYAPQPVPPREQLSPVPMPQVPNPITRDRNPVRNT